MKRFFAVFLTVMMLCVAAHAETERGDLSVRFGGETVLTHQETEYRVRKRLTNVLFMGMELDEETQKYETVMLILLSIDDNLKMVTPIMLDCTKECVSAEEAVQTEVLTEEVPENEVVTLGAVVSRYEDVKEGAQALVNEVNALLPDALIEDYLALDLAGLTLLDGLEGTEYEARMRAVASQFTSVSAGDVNRLLEELSPYLTTDMKSGALMKVVDKSERYERKSMLRLCLTEETVQNNPKLTLWTDELWTNTIIETFLEEKSLPW